MANAAAKDPASPVTPLLSADALGVQEAIPTELGKFKDGAIMVRVVKKVSRDKERKRERVMVITNFGMTICRFDGEVLRLVSWCKTQHLWRFQDFIVIRSGNQFDLMIQFVTHKYNTSHDTDDAVRLILQLCKSHSPAFHAHASRSHRELMDRARLVGDIDLSEIGKQDRRTLSQLALRTQLITHDHVFLATQALKLDTNHRGSSAAEMQWTKLERSAIRRRLARYFEVYNPGNLTKVDEIMEAYEGKEPQLMRAMQEKYGPDPTLNQGAALEAARARGLTPKVEPPKPRPAPPPVKDEEKDQEATAAPEDPGTPPVQSGDGDGMFNEWKSPWGDQASSEEGGSKPQSAAVTPKGAAAAGHKVPFQRVDPPTAAKLNPAPPETETTIEASAVGDETPNVPRPRMETIPPSGGGHDEEPVPLVRMDTLEEALAAEAPPTPQQQVNKESKAAAPLSTSPTPLVEEPAVSKIRIKRREESPLRKRSQQPSRGEVEDKEQPPVQGGGISALLEEARKKKLGGGSSQSFSQADQFQTSTSSAFTPYHGGVTEVIRSPSAFGTSQSSAPVTPSRQSVSLVHSRGGQSFHDPLLGSMSSTGTPVAHGLSPVQSSLLRMSANRSPFQPHHHSHQAAQYETPPSADPLLPNIPIQTPAVSTLVELFVTPSSPMRFADHSDDEEEIDVTDEFLRGLQQVSLSKTGVAFEEECRFRCNRSTGEILDVSADGEAPLRVSAGLFQAYRKWYRTEFPYELQVRDTTVTARFRTLDEEPEEDASCEVPPEFVEYVTFAFRDVGPLASRGAGVVVTLSVVATGRRVFEQRVSLSEWNRTVEQWNVAGL